MHVLSMFSNSMRSTGDFVLDLLDMLFGSFDVHTIDDLLRKPRDLLLGLVCNFIELTLDHVPLFTEIVLCIVELAVDLSFSLGS